MVKKRTIRSKSAASAAMTPSPASAPERKRSKSTGAIGRLVQQVQKTTLVKARRDGAAIERVEEGIRQRFIEDADVFDKDNLIAELITESRGNFKRMDVELTAQHTVSTNNLHRLVFHHSNNFLNLFRDVHRAHGLVDDLKKDVQSIKSTIAALSRVSFSKQEAVMESSDAHAGPVMGMRSAAGSSVARRTHRASMIVDVQSAELMESGSFHPTHMLQCASFRLASKVMQPPPSAMLTAHQSSTEATKQLEMFRDVALEEVRQRIGELQLTAAAEWIAALESEAFEKGLGPVVLQLEHELAAAAEAQLFRLPMAAAYFDALHLPLLRLLIQLGRAQTATSIYLKLHSKWIVAELRLLKEKTEPNDFCLVATDFLVSLIKTTLQNMSKLGIVTKRSSKRRASHSPGKHTKPVVAAQDDFAIPVVNAQVILWVRREIESFGSSVLAQHILTAYRSGGINVADGATQIGLVADIVATCVDSIRAIEGLGIPHADVHFMASITEPVTQLLRDLSTYTSKTQSTTSQSLWNAVKLAVRAQAKSPSVAPEEHKRLVDSVLAEITGLNRRLAQRLAGVAPSSHTQLVTMLCSPVSAHVFQSPINHKVSNETLHNLLKLGLKSDPFVWSMSRVARKIFAEAYASQPGCAREIVQSLSADVTTAIPRPFRLAVIEALGTYRFSALAIRKAQDRDTDERLAFLSAHAGAGLTTASLTPSALNQLLTRSDIATPHWSRAVRDIFSDALANRCGQMKGSLNNLLHVLHSHAGTNPITLTHRKIVVNVLRNRRFQAADIPEEMVERMDPTHLEWLFSPLCPTSHWSTSGPREYIGDVLDAQPQLGRPEWIKALRSDQVVDEATRTAIQAELQPMVAAVSAAEDGLRAMDDRVPSLDDVKQLLTPASAIAGQWPRRMRIIFACALEKKCAGYYFGKIGDVARRLRDHTQLRLSADDRRLVVSHLSSKADEFISGALASCGDTTADEQEELCATALLSPDHLTFLIARSDIGAPYWSRATRDAFADALERLQQKTSGSAQQPLIDLLRTTPVSVRISVEQRKHIRDALKRKVENDCSTSTREIARQQWMRVTPSVLQRMVLSTASQSLQGRNDNGSAAAGDIWCDIIRFVVSTALRRIIEHWEETIEVLRGPTRITINKSLRVEISGLLAGYAFTAGDIAKRSSAVDGKPDASARPQLASKSIVAHDDFTYTLNTAVGPSQLFHTTASVLLSLMAAAGSTCVAGNAKCVSALLQDAVMAEAVDTTLTSVASAMVGFLDRELAAVARLCKNKIVLQGWQNQTPAEPSRENTSWKTIFRYGIRNSPCDWIFQTFFALYVDALALAALTAFAQTKHGIVQLMGENVPARTHALRQFQCTRMAPFLSSLSTRLFVAANAGPMVATFSEGGQPLSKVVDELLLVRYFGSHTSISDVTIPTRMAGSIIPIEGYTAWRVATTVPGYPRFAFHEVRLDDEAFLFHYAVQLSLNGMAIFQGMFLGDYDDQTISSTSRTTKEPLNRSTAAFLSNLLPNDSSLMQHWIVLKGHGSNYIAASALLQQLVLEMIQRLCDLNGVLCSAYQRNGGINQESANPQVIRQILIFFAVMYYFWSPLFTSAYQSSLLAQGLLSGSTDSVPQPASSKKSGAAPSKPEDAHSTTSEVSLVNVDRQQPAKATLCSLTSIDQSSLSMAELPDDILAHEIVKFFATTPSLQKYTSALFSDAMKQKLAKLFTKVNLLEFAAKQTLGNDEDSTSEDEDDSDYSEPETPATPAATSAVITFAHLHELLVHYMRPLS